MISDDANTAVRGRVTGKNAKGESNSVNTTSLIRLLFVVLSVGCLMQIARDTVKILPDQNHVIYAKDGQVYTLRSHDPDGPTKNSQWHSQSHSQSHSGAAETTTTLHKEPQKDPDPIPRRTFHSLFRREQERIDNGINDKERCARYGVDVLPNEEKNQRRIFFGSMLATENPEVIAAHAIEVYNKYDVIALVESNTTHNGRPREMNYRPGSFNARFLQESQIFGSPEHTKVVVDYWLEDMPNVLYMDREVEQRNTIWKIWVDQGMTERDIGIMADLDEIISRDFLNAIQVCDFPKMRYDPNTRANCQTPKMSLSTVHFEASPLCIKKYEWFHPDLILGSCIKGVGDPVGRVTPQRANSPLGKRGKTLGRRVEEWGLYDFNKFPQDVIDNDRFPLWDGRDIREVHGNKDKLISFVPVVRKGHGRTAAFGTAYHLHNWFTDIEVLRHKFATYGHADDQALTQPLSWYEEDVNMLVRCARGLGNNITYEGSLPNSPYYENNVVLPEGSEQMFSLGGNRPIYFSNRTYVLERHALVQEMVRADEAKYGTDYKNTVE